MRQIFIILAAVLAFAAGISAGKDAEAASALATPAQMLALDQHVSASQQRNLSKADVRFHLYLGPRHRYYRRYHYYRYRPYRRRYYYRRHRSCSYWRRQCIRNWGYGNRNYYGCMRYHGCR